MYHASNDSPGCRLAHLWKLVVPLLILSPTWAQTPDHKVSAAVKQPPIIVNVLEEIHITGNCRIYQKNTPNKKPRFFTDPGICHQESAKHLIETQTSLQNSVPVRVEYEINESDYLLHNFTDHPVAFVLDQKLADGWQVITDPQPMDVSGQMATYRVLAQPGQTVRLHTGQRRLHH